ncbi:uncharacterized protein C22orf31-like isoform X1 [Xyrichtys novacula]|uniref:Uncharacterized protein C22orf31-like isoform X1 n=1 Tax=Xyrichtys novacula TaxID=13765 RepID=A0AAV1F3J4_XYRNO|nr:uncharacterized protein C22orf31-like isoform X1 [Xyrichtys novacula]
MTARKEVTSRCAGREVTANQQRSSDHLIHGLSVDRYRQIYGAVLQPSVLSALSSSKPTDYVCGVLELKRRLWEALSRPQLQERLMEDGRVEVTEMFDLT